MPSGFSVPHTLAFLPFWMACHSGCLPQQPGCLTILAAPASPVLSCPSRPGFLAILAGFPFWLSTAASGLSYYPGYPPILVVLPSWLFCRPEILDVLPTMQSCCPELAVLSFFSGYPVILPILSSWLSSHPGYPVILAGLPFWLSSSNILAILSSKPVCRPGRPAILDVL
jgi:hypothetical protein